MYLLSFVQSKSAVFALSVLPLLASGIAEVDTGAKVIITLFVYLVRIIGIGLALWGGVELGMGINGDDHTAKSKGIQRILGGVVVIFVPEIIGLIYPAFKSMY